MLELKVRSKTIFSSKRALINCPLFPADDSEASEPETKKRRKTSTDSAEDKDKDESKKESTSADRTGGVVPRQRWKSTTGIPQDETSSDAAAANDDDNHDGGKSRHASTPGPNAAAGTDEGASGSGLGLGSFWGTFAAAAAVNKALSNSPVSPARPDDNLVKLREAYQMLLKTLADMIDICNKKLFIKTECGAGAATAENDDDDDNEDDDKGNDEPNRGGEKSKKKSQASSGSEGADSKNIS